MRLKTTIIALLLAFGFTALYAQDRKALRINEVMVVNENSIVDRYNQHNAWIELFNGNFGPLEISSVYLTNDSTNPMKYPVPIGDELTRMGKRQHVIFFADGEPNKGTFHTNFTLEPGKDNWIGIYDADTTLIDYVVIPASLPANATYARSEDGTGEWVVKTGGEDDYITPSGANIIKGENPKIKKFAEEDANGFSMTIMAMCIVFTALLVLCLCFYGIGRIGKKVSRSNKMKATGISKEEIMATADEGHDSGEEIAAITMALHEHLNSHDQESTILTINKVKRAYSPWSSKIYNLRQVPELPRKHAQRK